MRGRYLKPRNCWEIAWNIAFDLQEASKKGVEASESPTEPYDAALRASDYARRKEDVPHEEWNYEECRRYTQLELDNRKKFQEWASCYMPEEEEERRKRARNMNGTIS